MIFEKTKAIISEQFNVEEEDISMETSFKDDLDADSLDLVEIIMVLEDEFELEINDEMVESIRTVGDAVKYLMELLGED